MTNSSDYVFSGKAIYHLQSCPLRAWLYIRHMLQVDCHNPYIRTGEQRDTRLTEGKRCLPLMDYGKVDFSTGHQSTLVIHDVTRSEAPDPPKLHQLNYYLYAVKELYGCDAEGALHTSDGKVHRIELDVEEAEKDIKALEALTQSSIPPTPVLIPKCKGCTNFYWCFS